jgi:hypothetical protein
VGNWCAQVHAHALEPQALQLPFDGLMDPLFIYYIYIGLYSNFNIRDISIY